jgi:hypothetical protein
MLISKLPDPQAEAFERNISAQHHAVQLTTNQYKPGTITFSSKKNILQPTMTFLYNSWGSAAGYIMGTQRVTRCPSQNGSTLPASTSLSTEWQRANRIKLHTFIWWKSMAKELSKRRAGRNRNKMSSGSIFDPAPKKNKNKKSMRDWSLKKSQTTFIHIKWKMQQ